MSARDIAVPGLDVGLLTTKRESSFKSKKPPNLSVIDTERRSSWRLPRVDSGIVNIEIMNKNLQTIEEDQSRENEGIKGLNDMFAHFEELEIEEDNV